MKPDERRKHILDLLQVLQKELRVEDLAEMLEVSPLTIRRDLDELATRKTIIRTHGGCLSVGRAALETEYHKKVAKNFDLKRSIGLEAVRRIDNGMHILLNDGSTTFHLATQLPGRGPLTVTTNSIAIITILAGDPAITLEIIGGTYNNEAYSLRGGLAEKMVEDLFFDLLFLGADAIDEEGRCMGSSAEEARLLQIMIRRSTRCILLADSTKIGRKGYFAFGRLSDFSEWITNRRSEHGGNEAGEETDELMEQFSKLTEITYT